MLLPQALCTIAAVALLYATVRRVAGPAAGLIAAVALALTPITVAIGRVNNPDALLVLLLVASAYFRSGRSSPAAASTSRWAGALVGLAFMTKMLQGWMVVPALGAAYLLAGHAVAARRVRQLAVAGVVMVAVSAAWPLAVTLWPGSTPYIGGSTDGSVWDLILGYNGFGRIFGEGGGRAAAAARASAAPPGMLADVQRAGRRPDRLAAAARRASGLVAGLWMTRRAPRTDLRRAGLVLFGVWALVHVAVFSTQQGIFHPYYVSALAPAVAALAGIGVVTLWRGARSWAGWRARRPLPAPRGWRWSCSAARRTSRRGCGSRSRSPRRSRSSRSVALRTPGARAALAVAGRRRSARARRRPGGLHASPTSATR